MCILDGETGTRAETYGSLDEGAKKDHLFSEKGHLRPPSLWRGCWPSLQPGFWIAGIGPNKVGLWLQESRSQPTGGQERATRKKSKETRRRRNGEVVTLCGRESTN